VTGQPGAGGAARRVIFSLLFFYQPDSNWPSESPWPVYWCPSGQWASTELLSGLQEPSADRTRRAATQL